jgi:ATP-dependent Zn protease
VRVTDTSTDFLQQPLYKDQVAFSSQSADSASSRLIKEIHMRPPINSSRIRFGSRVCQTQRRSRHVLRAQSGAKPMSRDKPHVSFVEVAVGEAKEVLTEAVAFLKHTEKFVVLSARRPKGVFMSWWGRWEPARLRSATRRR